MAKPKTSTKPRLKWKAAYAPSGRPVERYDTEIGDIRVVLHHYIGCGDEVFLSAYGTPYQRVPLKVTSFEEAQLKAEELLLTLAQTILKALKG